MMSHEPGDRRPNGLAGETSPYLLSHAFNPVDWRPWGEAAFAAARERNLPIFLSVGYSACHWCHVMERESFEDEKIAEVLNERFVSIKVDREERPDIDQIYMTAVQALTGRGGWPMSVFLTPDLKPFYGGTYYPPTDRHGMPGFPRVLLSVSDAWNKRRDELMASADQLTDQIRGMSLIPGGPGGLGPQLIKSACDRLSRSFDPVHGGFGSAPKFPHPMDLTLLLRGYQRFGDERSLAIVVHTLDCMARGGIRDHLGGGFARYSTDDRWLVPHFEKMLYDNALLARIYAEAFLITRNQALADTVDSTLHYLIDHMMSPEGAFHSTEDADSEGEEGKFYVWTRREIVEILGPLKGGTFADIYDASAEGNWERGVSILNLRRSLATEAKLLGRDLAELEGELALSRARLFEARRLRVPPAMDTKILTSWNGLAISALAVASRLPGRSRDLEIARRAGDFLLRTMRTPAGLLLHSFKDGQARFLGCLDDYAYLIEGLALLFEAGGGVRFLAAAVELAQAMISEFSDEAGGFFYTGKSHESLIARTKDIYDNATPGASASAATALLRLSSLTGRDDFAALARGTLHQAQAILENAPQAAAQSLIALDFELGTAREAVIVEGEDPAEFAAALDLVHSRFDPGRVVIPVAKSDRAELESLSGPVRDRPAIGGKATVYFCEDYACKAPWPGLEAIQSGLEATSSRD